MNTIIKNVKYLGSFLLAVSMVASFTLHAAEPQSLEERLQATEDYIKIEQLLMSYAVAFGTGDADAYVNTFAPDGELELLRAEGEEPFLGPFKGRDVLRKQWFPDAPADTATSSGEPRVWGGMRHVTTNPLIIVDGNTATVEAFFIEVVSNGENIPPGSLPPTIHAMGRYMDKLVKLDGQWYFSKRSVITDMNTRWEPD
jgi:hypothetical protein